MMLSWNLRRRARYSAHGSPGFLDALPPDPLGTSGLPALGGQAEHEHIVYGIPNVLHTKGVIGVCSRLRQ